MRLLNVSLPLRKPCDAAEAVPMWLRPLSAEDVNPSGLYEPWALLAAGLIVTMLAATVNNNYG